MNIGTTNTKITKERSLLLRCKCCDQIGQTWRSTSWTLSNWNLCVGACFNWKREHFAMKYFLLEKRSKTYQYYSQGYCDLNWRILIAHSLESNLSITWNVALISFWWVWVEKTCMRWNASMEDGHVHDELKRPWLLSAEIYEALCTAILLCLDSSCVIKSSKFWQWWTSVL